MKYVKSADLTLLVLPNAGGLIPPGSRFGARRGLEKGLVSIPQVPAVGRAEYGRLPGVGR